MKYLKFVCQHRYWIYRQTIAFTDESCLLFHKLAELCRIWQKIRKLENNHHSTIGHIQSGVASILSGEYFRGIFWRHPSLWMTVWTDLTIHRYILNTYTYICTLLLLEMLAYFVLTVQYIIQLKLYLCGWNSTMILINLPKY